MAITPPESPINIRSLQPINGEVRKVPAIRALKRLSELRGNPLGLRGAKNAVDALVAAGQPIIIHRYHETDDEWVLIGWLLSDNGLSTYVEEITPHPVYI